MLKLQIEIYRKVVVATAKIWNTMFNISSEGPGFVADFARQQNTKYKPL